MPISPETALKLLKQYGTATRAAEEAGMVRSTFQRLVRKAQDNPREIPAQKAQGKKLSEFREKYDKSYYIPKKVQAALAQLGSGWEAEVEFARLAGVSLQDLATVRPEFEEYVVPVERGSRRVWVGSKKMADQMRKML